MKMNKKGSGFFGYETTNKVFIYILFLMFIGIFLTLFILGMVRNYDSKIALEKSVDADFEISRMTNLCLAYEDDNGQIQQNVIDISKITDLNLKDCFKSKYPPSFGIELLPINKGDFVSVKASIGGTSYSDFSFMRYVLVKDIDGKLKPGTLMYRP